MKRSIVHKIFISIFLLFLIFLIIQLVIQNTYLDDIYYSTKSNKINKEFVSFIQKYKDNYWTEEELNRKTTVYSLNNNSPILLIDENGKVLNTSFYNGFNTITVNVYKKDEKIIIMDFLNDMKHMSLEDIPLSIGDKIYVQGIKIDKGNFIEPINIHHNYIIYTDKEMKSEWENNLNENIDVLALVGGTVKEINYIEEELENFNFQSSKLWKEVKKVLYSKSNIVFKPMSDLKLDSFEKGTNSFKIPAFNGDMVILSDKVKRSDGSSIYVFTIYQIEHVANVFETLNPFFIYLYSFYFLVLLIMIFFYSKWITKPFLHINDAAKKIANLDFSTRIDIKTGDELEELSDSLNTLSVNLEKNITEIKETNKLLADEAIQRAESEKRTRFLLTSLSHEFKTPLGIISGFLEIINDGVCEKAPEYYLNTISEEIDHLNSLVLETIELSKLETGYYNLSLEIFNIKECIEQTILSFEILLKEKDIKLIKKLDSYKVYADKKKIEQVLINLISNAVNYTEPHQFIYIKTFDNKDYVLITIENTGVNISNEDLQNIWNRYYRPEKTKSHFFVGSGLGLEIVKSLLQLHESNFGIKNLDDRVQFYFTLKKDL